MVTLLFALIVSATPPATCDELWPKVWKAYEEKELKGHRPPPLFEKVPDAKERLGRAWVIQCGAFDQPTLDCARGVQLELEIAEMRRALSEQKVPPKQIAEVISKAREEWSVLECHQVNKALDRAGAAVAREVLDAGVRTR